MEKLALMFQILVRLLLPYLKTLELYLSVSVPTDGFIMALNPELLYSFPFFFGSGFNLNGF